VVSTWFTHFISAGVLREYAGSAENRRPVCATSFRPARGGTAAPFGSGSPRRGPDGRGVATRIRAVLRTYHSAAQPRGGTESAALLGCAKYFAQSTCAGACPIDVQSGKKTAWNSDPDRRPGSRPSRGAARRGRDRAGCLRNNP